MQADDEIDLLPGPREVNLRELFMARMRKQRCLLDLVRPRGRGVLSPPGGPPGRSASSQRFLRMRAMNSSRKFTSRGLGSRSIFIIGLQCLRHRLGPLGPAA